MPKLLKTPFAVDAAEGFRTDIQESTGAAPNSATYQVGFPPVTMQSIASNGMPPKGSDLNGVLYDITDNLVFLTQGGGYGFDAAYATSIGGYPLNARLRLTSGDIVKSTIDGNTNDPNVDMTGWVNSELEQKFKTAEILTPEMFGAVGDGVTNDTQALIDMFKSCTDMPTGSGITAAQINAKLASNNYKKIRITKLYRCTKPTHVPPCVQFDQPITGFFSKNAGTIGIFYDPIDSERDTYAISPFVYKRDSDGTYSLNTNPYELPTGRQFDDGSYIMTGQRIDLGNLSVCTKPNVTLGFRLVGFAGSIAGAINVGTNEGSNSRIPKVGILTNGCWRSVFNAPSVLASVQGWVNWGSNGGMTVNNPYINRGYNSTPLADITPVFNPETHTEKGAIAVTNAADAFWNQPITEHWYFNYVATHHLRVLHPHIEGSSTRNVFYMIARNNNAISADIQLKPVLTVDPSNPLSSIVYLKNCDIQSAIALTGRVLSAATVVRGENSNACVTFDVSRNHYFIQTAKWGDLSLIRSINNAWVEKTIYVDPVNGNDEAVGLRNTNALKTFSKVKLLAELMGIREVNLVSTYTHTGYTTLHKDVIFTGAELIVGGGALEFNDRNLDVHFNNTKLTAATGVTPIQVKGVSYGSFNFTCELANQTTLINCQNNTNLTVNITNNTIADKTFVSCATSYKTYVNLNIKTTSTLTAAPVGSNVVLVNAPHMLSSISVAAQTIQAGERTVLATIALGGIRFGDNVLLSYSTNLNGLDLKGYVSSDNTVSCYFENSTSSPISLSSGNVIAKRV